jgi:transcriptional regulator of acetoin/glycerol metabolism
MKSIKLNKPLPQIDGRLYERMLSYSWPGNIRELENYIENIVNFNGTPTIGIPGNNDIKYEDINHQQGEDKIPTLEELERSTIIKCIEKYSGNMSRVSHSLGICRSTLYNKIKQYNIAI